MTTSGEGTSEERPFHLRPVVWTVAVAIISLAGLALSGLLTTRGTPSGVGGGRGDLATFRGRIIDWGGAPVASVTVLSLRSTDLVVETETNMRGEFTFSGVDPNERLALRVRVPAGYRAMELVGVGFNETPVDIILSSGGYVAGRIVLPERAPPPSLEVVASWARSGRWDPCGVTADVDGDGKFRCAGVPVGCPITLSLTPACSERTGLRADPVVVVGGQDGVVLRLAVGMVVAGSALGAPRDVDLMVRLERLGTTLPLPPFRYRALDASGGFRFIGLPPRGSTG